MCPYSSFIFISHCRPCQLHCLCQKAFGKRKCHENHCNYRFKPTPAGSGQPLQKLFLWLGPHVHIHISLFSHVSVFLLLFIKQKPPCSANLQQFVPPNSGSLHKYDVFSRLKTSLLCKCWLDGTGAFWSSELCAGRSYKANLSKPVKLHRWVTHTNVVHKVKGILMSSRKSWALTEHHHRDGCKQPLKLRSSAALL